jgi:hypothetical protein
MIKDERGMIEMIRDENGTKGASKDERGIKETIKDERGTKGASKDEIERKK